jgi:sulfite exporter TauE/SafE
MELIIAAIVASFIGSLHCVGMCGPLVAFAVGDPNGESRRSPVWRHAAYHGGRLLTYMIVGAACGALGAAIDRGGARFGMHRAAALTAGGMMIAVGFAAVLRAAGARLPALPLPRLIQRGILFGQRAAFALKPLPRAMCVGLLTAFLPCGWLYLFASYAAGTGSSIWGAAFMAAFWLGSVPALLAAGVGAQALAKYLGRRLPLVTALIIVALGVVTLVLRMHSPVRAFEPVQIQQGAESVRQVEVLGKTVPPCCQKRETQEGAP